MKELGFWHCSIAVYEVSLQAIERVSLPRYKGSTLDGAIDSAFHAVVCRKRHGKCPCSRVCPYAIIFKPQPIIGQNGDKTLQRYKEAPKAYVVEPPLDHKGIFQPGEFLHFRILLFGKSIRYFPWFIVALQAMGQTGMGKGRGKVELAEIYSVHPLNGMRRPIYLCDSETGLLPNESLLVDKEDIVRGSQGFTSNEITLEFLTPTRIRMRDTWVNKPTFTQIIITILRRAELLSRFYGQGISNACWSDLLEDADSVALKVDSLSWYDWKRYSRPQQDILGMGGIVGTVTYVGEALSRFMPYLLLGQLMHIGKGYVYGMGKYVVRNGNGEAIWDGYTMI